MVPGALATVTPCLAARPGARPDLGLEAHRQGNGNAGRDDPALQRAQLDVLVDGGQQIGASRRRRRIVGQLQVTAVRQPHDLDLDALDALHRPPV